MGLTKHYDAVIIGGGIGGLMCAYRLSEKKPDMKILILERGKDLENRKCPILTGKVTKCIKCKTCAIMEGMAGAGAFSDGKYNITTEYGGWLPRVMDEKKVMDYILQADSILVQHGAQKEVYEPDNELKTLCLQHDLHFFFTDLCPVHGQIELPDKIVKGLIDGDAFHIRISELPGMGVVIIDLYRIRIGLLNDPHDVVHDVLVRQGGIDVVLPVFHVFQQFL